MPQNNVLALDVGEKRVGLALARAEVRVPVVLETLERQSDSFWEKMDGLLKQHEIDLVVVGLPRGLEGQETAQTRYVQAFAQEFSRHFQLPIHWQDEALTSAQAEGILNSAGKPYAKGDVDGLAASLILSDYMESQRISNTAGSEV